MYQLASLSKTSIDFINATSVGGGSRSSLFALAVGYCVGRSLALPLNVDDVSAYYREQLQADVLCRIDSVNGVLPHNFEESKNAAQAFFKFRYASANPKVIPLAFSKETAIEDFFGLTEFFSNGVLDLIRAQPDAMTRYVAGITNILLELDADKRAKDQAYGNSDYGQMNRDSSNYVAP